jgi:hypothetical protein
MTRVFIHSWHGDFAKTQWVSEMDYLGRAVSGPSPPLQLFRCGCGCGTGYLRRIRRPLWMRWIPGFRLYRCLRCRAPVARLRLRQRRLYPSY